MVVYVGVSLQSTRGCVCRRISTINAWLEGQGYDVTRMWADIDDAVVKTIISAHAVLKHNYRTCFPNHVRGSACFEILGFDVVLDRKLRPFVLEVSQSASFFLMLCRFSFVKEIVTEFVFV